MTIWYLILIVAIIVGMTWWVGSWNLMLNLINFFIASMVASSFFEPVADLLESFNNTFTYIVDYIAIWLLFVLTFIALRLATDFLTKYQLRMNIWAEYGLRTVLSLWLAGGFVCFTFFTFHLAPFPTSKFIDNPTQQLFGFGPDQKWMAFVQSRSRGALASGKNAAFLPEYDLVGHPEDAKLESRVFDPNAEFGAKYLERRIKLSESKTLRVSK